MSSRVGSWVSCILAMEVPQICKEGSCNKRDFPPTVLPSSEKTVACKTKPESQANFSLFQDAIRTLNTLQTNASYLEQVKRERGDPQLQLQSMAGFLERTGLKVEDLDQLNIIHVTGTKGKGSACAFTERILRNYNLKTGFYSSPHLVQVRERIRINGQPISQELFSKYFWQVYNRLEETKDSHHASMPAYFRFLTIMAFHVFLQEKVDLAVIEVGIGGAYDCTNIVRKPIVCGVSSLGIDHTSILGDTIEKIAWQKGGIFKPGVPAFTVPQPERPLEVLKQRAEECQCPLFLCPDLDDFEDDDKLLQLGLAGDHQRSNAALALQLSHMWLDRCGYLDTGELKDSWQTSEAPSKKVPSLAPAFKPDQPMVQAIHQVSPGRRTISWLKQSNSVESSFGSVPPRTSVDGVQSHMGSRNGKIQLRCLKVTGERRDSLASPNLLIKRFLNSLFKAVSSRV